VVEKAGAPPVLEVPFNRPYTTGAELGHIEEAIGGAHLSGNGPFTRKCTDWLERELDAPRVLLTHSCTGALELGAVLADVGPGDEVVMPSFTFSSTATAFVLRGATPVFVDVREDTLNLDERLVEQAVTDRTRAVVPVHYGGVGCDMNAILSTACGHDLVVIEDAAHALGGASLDGKPLGAFGQLGALSFHETKNIICGEGGALVVNNPALVERAEIVHEKGTNRRAFFRGQVDKYSWVDVGSSFPAGELAAAFLWAQLERAEWLIEQRLAVWERYHSGFAELESVGLLRRPVVPEGARHSAHLYYLLLPNEEQRDHVIDELARERIQAVFHYVPLHSSPAGRRYGRPAGELPVTDRVSSTLLRLPLWIGISEEQVNHVVSTVGRILA
jgi:dTDP-4-amino-4,6-dideoxygalactose transaminase